MTESSAKDESAASAPSKSDLRDLWLVNDDTSQLMIQERVLGRSHFSVRAFASPLEAVAAARTGGSSPYLVTDTNMPGMSGSELARFWLELHPTGRVLIVSASCLTSEQQQAVEALPEQSVRLLSSYRIGELHPEAKSWFLDGQAHRPAEPGSAPPPISAAGVGGAFDQLAWGKLSSLGGEAFLRRALLRFLQGGREKMEALAAASQAGDREALHSRAHALKGSAGLVGAQRLLETADRLEVLTAPDLPNSTDQEIQESYRRLEAVWQDCLAALPGDLEEPR